MLLPSWTLWGLVVVHHQKGLGIIIMIIISEVIIPSSNSIEIMIIAIVINKTHPGLKLTFTVQMEADM